MVRTGRGEVVAIDTGELGRRAAEIAMDLAGGKKMTDIPGATQASYTTPAATLADHQRQFRARISNSAGSLNSAAATRKKKKVSSRKKTMRMA